MTEIHPTAIIDIKAELASDVIIGPYSIIKGCVTLGAGTIVHDHSHIHGNTVIGKNCRIGPAAYIGLAPQHLRFDGKGTRLIIGDDVIIRETATVHRSISPDPGRATRIGNGCMLMVASHVGHDVELGDGVILANAVLLGGHVIVGERAFLGGGTAIHQFVRLGRLAIIAGNEAITQDVPPFAAARYRGLKGYNAIGCKRSGMSAEAIHSIRSAYYSIHTHRTVPDAMQAMLRLPQTPELKELTDFLTSTKRGILRSVRFIRMQLGMDAE